MYDIYNTYNIAILLPLTKNINNKFNNWDDLPFFKHFLNFFNKTKEEQFTYYIFCSYEDNDVIYLKYDEKIRENVYKIIILDNTKTNYLVDIYNELALLAYNDKNIYFDYFFQLKDNAEIYNKYWSSVFVSKLQNKYNLGVISPINLEKYNHEYDYKENHNIKFPFVHRTHIDIFNTFYNNIYKNNFYNDWIANIYKNIYCEVEKEIIIFYKEEFNLISVKNLTSFNKVIERDINIIIKHINNNISIYNNINNLIITNIPKQHYKFGKNIISYCLYSNKKRHCLGLIKNLEQIKLYFNNYFEVYIHMGNDVPTKYIDIIKTFDNVNIIYYNFSNEILLLYRFFIYDKSDIYCMIVLDTSSRITTRLIWCINHFLNSFYNVFTIRDHYTHNSTLTTNLIGFKNININFLEIFKRDFLMFNNNLNITYSNIENFINYCVYKRFFENLIIYTDLIKYENENTIAIEVSKKHDNDFCGNIINFNSDNTEYYIL